MDNIVVVLSSHFKYQSFNKSLHYLYALIFTTFTLLSYQLAAEEIKLDNIASFNSSKHVSWLTPVSLSGQFNTFASINNLNQLFLISQDGIKQVSLNDYIENKSKVTAYSFHPNFHLKEQPGYATLYTAHIEAKTSNKTKSLLVKNLEKAYQDEMVIREWVFTSSNNLSLSNKNIRDVLKIPSVNKHSFISQLTFNPHIKSWDESHGELYIVINGDKSYLDTPIYSGSILRVNPQKYGNRPYSIPAHNPFLKQTTIQNEILLYGALGVTELIWQKGNKANYLVTWSHQGNSYLSKTEAGKADSDTLLKNKISESQQGISQITNYQGRVFSSLKDKFVFLSNTNNNWQLIATDTKKANMLDTLSLKLSTSLDLLSDSNNELVIFDKQTGKFYSLKSSILPAQSNETKPKDGMPEPRVTNLLNIIILVVTIIIVVLVMGIMLLRYNRKRIPKGILHKKFSRFELNETNKVVELYLRHEKEINCLIPIDNIKQCDLLLNGSIITTVNRTENITFNQKSEFQLNQSILKEKREKMIDERTRKLELVLTLLDSTKHLVCFYLRKGNHRLTKPCFDSSINQATKLLWLVSQSINPNIVLPQNKNLLSQSEAKVNNNALSNKSKRDIVKNVDLNKTSQQSITDKASNSDGEDKESNDTVQQGSPNSHNKQLDIEIVVTLEKLALLKQKGLLSDDEFSSAKEKLLQDLLK